MEFTGQLETHITVDLEDLNALERITAWSSHNGFKFLHILLERGVTVSQPMLTRHGWGELTRELSLALNFCIALKAEGFSVLRLKIEAALENQDIPQSHSAALNHPRERYFEHHLKLLLKPDADLLPLKALVEQHSAHLSRNILKTRSDHYQERFITQRCLAVGCVEAQQRLQTLLQALSSFGYFLLKVESEFVVYDSNLNLDTGWILTPTST